MQHVKIYVSKRSVADETKTTNLLHRKSEIPDVGSLEKGDYLHQIAQLFDRHHPSIHRILSETGGIRPTQRRRSKLALTLTEREELSRALVDFDNAFLRSSGID